MPDLESLAAAAVAGDPRTTRNRKATLAAGLNRILAPYKDKFCTVIPIADLEALRDLLRQPAKRGE